MENTITKDELSHLIDGMAMRRESALETLYELTVNKVYSLALKITRRQDWAEEVVQDTYWQAWQEVTRFDSAKGPVIAWLMIICRSRAIDFLRRIKETNYADMSNFDATKVERISDCEPSEELLKLREASSLHDAFRHLSPLQRQLIALAFFRGLTHEEISLQMNIPLGTVKTNIRRAQAALKSALI